MKQYPDPTLGMDPPVSPGKLLDVSQVADVLGCGRTMVYTLFDRGELRQVKIGRLTRVASSEVDRYVRRQMGMEDDDTTAGQRQQAPRRPATAPGLTLPF